MTITSSGANAYTAYIAETTFGTTPATPTLIGIPLNVFNINLTKENTKDSSIQIDGQSRYTSFGNQTVTGDFEDSLTTLHDPFLQAAMRSTYATGILKMGNTETSFSWEQGFPSTSLYRVFTGIEIDKLAITVPVAGDVTAKYSVMGKAMTMSSTTIDPGGITVPAVIKPMKHNGGSVTEGGSTIANITTINLNIDNSMTTNYTLGNSSITSISAGPRKVSGTFTALFTDSALMTKFINGTQTSFGFTVSNGTNSYTFLASNVSYTAATVNVTPAATIPVQVAFECDYDPTSASSLVITKA